MLDYLDKMDYLVFLEKKEMAAIQVNLDVKVYLVFPVQKVLQVFLVFLVLLVS